MENHSAKHFALQLGSLISLYLSVSFLLVLLFGIVNLAFPDPAETIWETENAQNMVRLGFAMVIVFFPTYLVLTRSVNVARRHDPESSYLGLTKWLIYLSLLVGGTAILIDLVIVIMAFLEGELTQRFILKALSVLLVVGAACFYYLQDARGFWITREKCSVRFGAVASVLVLIVLITGITQIESPAEYREYRIDQTQVSDLQQLQWQIQDHLLVHGALPEYLDELSGLKLPTAPDERPPYRYEVTETGFLLCATFAANSKETDLYYERPLLPVTVEQPTIVNPDNWTHEAGEWCFERVVQAPKE